MSATEFDWRSFSDEAVQAIRSHQHPATGPSRDCLECKSVLDRYDEARGTVDA